MKTKQIATRRHRASKVERKSNFNVLKGAKENRKCKNILKAAKKMA